MELFYSDAEGRDYFIALVADTFTNGNENEMGMMAALNKTKFPNGKVTKGDELMGLCVHLGRSRSDLVAHRPHLITKAKIYFRTKRGFAAENSVMRMTGRGNGTRRRAMWKEQCRHDEASCIQTIGRSWR